MKIIAAFQGRPGISAHAEAVLRRLVAGEGDKEIVFSACGIVGVFVVPREDTIHEVDRGHITRSDPQEDARLSVQPRLQGDSAFFAGELEEPFHLGKEESLQRSQAGCIIPRNLVRAGDLIIVHLSAGSARWRHHCGLSEQPARQGVERFLRDLEDLLTHLRLPRFSPVRALHSIRHPRLSSPARRKPSLSARRAAAPPRPAPLHLSAGRWRTRLFVL